MATDVSEVEPEVGATPHAGAPDGASESDPQGDWARPGQTTESDTPRRSWKRRGPECLVLLAVLFNLWVLRAERFPVAYPNDSAVHLQMVAFAQHLLSSGQFPLDHWYPYLSQGSPFFVQYQSASAIITGAMGQLIGPQQALLDVVSAFVTWPLCIYWTGRLLGWSRWASASSAAISPLLVSVTGYGYEYESYVAIGNGLWSQLWAMWTLPLAWGFSWRYVEPAAISVRRRLDVGPHHRLSLLDGVSCGPSLMCGSSWDPATSSTHRPGLVDWHRRNPGDPLGHRPAPRRFQMDRRERVPGREVLDRLLRGAPGAQVARHRENLRQWSVSDGDDPGRDRSHRLRRRFRKERGLGPLSAYGFSAFCSSSDARHWARS